MQVRSARSDPAFLFVEMVKSLIRAEKQTSNQRAAEQELKVRMSETRHIRLENSKASDKLFV